MGAEFMIDSGLGTDSSTYGEFHLTLTMSGDPEDLRERLGSAAEKLGYRIVSDDPLVARRSGSGYGSITSTVIDYARTLTFRLKVSEAGATAVTFNYVGYPLNYKGARAVITREAEAIAALAVVRLDWAACSGCGAATADDSRFCRRCGVPAFGQPAELEVLRITNAAHAGTKDLMLGATGFALAIITFVLISTLKGIGHINAAAGFALMLALPSLFLTVMGFRHLARTFDAKQIDRAERLNAQVELPTGMTSRLPVSVTEGTTNLLTPSLAADKPNTVTTKD